MKYIEFGIGNTWLVRTEFEDDEGNEYEVPGISGSVYPVGYYFRIWIGKRGWTIVPTSSIFTNIVR